MKLTIDNGNEILASIDLGEPLGADHDKTGYAGGDLGFTSGNAYLRIDGVEYGSLFIFASPEGQPLIMLGQFDHEADEWIEKHTISAIPAEYQMKMPEATH